MIFIKIGLILLLFQTGTSFAAEYTLQYQDLRKLFEENNKEIKGDSYYIDAQKQRTGFLGRSYLPRVTGNAGQEKFTTGPYASVSQSYGEVVARVNLYNGGKDSIEEDKREYGLMLSRVQYEQTLFERLFLLRQLYWTTVAAKEQLDNFHLALKMNEDNQRSANIRIQGGIATQTDRIEFEQNKLELLQLIQKQEIELANAERELKAILNIEQSLVLQTLTTSPHNEEKILNDKFILSEQRDLKALRFEQEIVNFNRKQQIRWWTPDVDVYAGYMQYTFRERDYLSAKDRDDTAIGIRVSFNFFDGGESFNNAQVYIHEVRALSSKKEQAQVMLETRLNNKCQYLSVIDKLVHIADENIKKSEVYFKNTLEEYRRGIKNSVDVLQASNRLITSKNEWIERKKDYLITQAEIDSLKGE